MEVVAVYNVHGQCNKDILVRCVILTTDGINVAHMLFSLMTNTTYDDSGVRQARWSN